MLPSFPSLRERNLRTLYGGADVSDYVDDDKSPKGSVDAKIRPLVDLLNRHPEYVTLSSCSGRVALFDPDGSCDCDAADGRLASGEGQKDAKDSQKEKGLTKGTTISGKGRGKWIFVTHDVLPDLGKRIIHSLKAAGEERRAGRQTTDGNASQERKNSSPITFKHEPPLLHVAAASLAAGKRLLRLAKSVCAMRESGLVVTDRRVTVELRTTGTSLCVPMLLQTTPSIALAPDEFYLLSLAKMANERMVQNERLLDRLLEAVRVELFEDAIAISSSDHKATESSDSDDRGDGNNYDVSLRPLPSLNLWRTAAVVLPRKESGGSDLDVLAFGGQGTGPLQVGGVSRRDASTCRRRDSVFRLTRRGGSWSDHWDTIPIVSTLTPSNNDSDVDQPKESRLTTDAGTFQVHLAESSGPREGHCACVLPSRQRAGAVDSSEPSVVALFGGRTGGPMSPTNDFFLFVLSKTQSEVEAGVIGRPTDVRGTSPEPRFGHSMTALHANSGAKFLQHRETLAVVAGGTGIHVSQGSASVSASLSSVYILSRSFGGESEFSHFMWDCLVDGQLLYPRTYHTIAMKFTPETTSMFVFGGVKDVTDPFDACGSRNTGAWFEQPLFEKSAKQIRRDSFPELPPLIGSSATALVLESKLLVLHVGGAKTPNSGMDNESYGPLNIFSVCSDKERLANELTHTQICFVGRNSACANEECPSDSVDFGSCVHHCLVALPDEEGTAITVGGGVPCFSFGQSYARSYLIDVTRAKCNKATPKPLRDHSQTRQQSKNLSVTSDGPPSKTINGNQVDVVYVSARHAKTVKTGLESLKFLDKRYKMIKAESVRLSGTVTEDRTCERNLIAIPITKQYSNQKMSTESSSDLTSSIRLDTAFERLIIGRGTEIVPFSSSSMGKLRQRNVVWK